MWSIIFTCKEERRVVFFSKLLKVISHKKYQKNPLGKKLSPLQQSVLNIGAVNAEQTMFYCDSLETGSEKEEIRNNLAAYYDIIDEESALHTLEWLLERGHRVYFDAIKLFSAGISPSITDEILTPDEQLDTPRYMKNVKEMIESLTEKDISVPRRIYGINLFLRGTWGGWC